MALTPIKEVRLTVGDTSEEFPILSDESYEYFLSKNEDSVRRASIDAAKAIILQLAMRTDETVDIFSIKGSKAAEQYRMALNMFLKDPALNPVLTSGSGYAGGISKSDMEANIENEDNNAVITPGMSMNEVPTMAFEV